MRRNPIIELSLGKDSYLIPLKTGGWPSLTSSQKRSKRCRKFLELEHYHQMNASYLLASNYSKISECKATGIPYSLHSVWLSMLTSIIESPSMQGRKVRLSILPENIISAHKPNPESFLNTILATVYKEIGDGNGYEILKDFLLAPFSSHGRRGKLDIPLMLIWQSILLPFLVGLEFIPSMLAAKIFS